MEPTGETAVRGQEAPGGSRVSGARKEITEDGPARPPHRPSSCGADSPQPGSSPMWGGGTGQEGEGVGASYDSSCIIFTKPSSHFVDGKTESHSYSVVEPGFKPRSVGFLGPPAQGRDVQAGPLRK